MKRINVTEPFLPPFEEYVEYLKGIWERNWLTNQGPLVQEFEQKLQAYHSLSTPVHCVTNGALGLQIALKALDVKGEVVTTPFSYVATTACPLWEGCTVKFADIEPDTLTIDPQAVEAEITSETEAILATHVFGNPCDVEALDALGAKHGLAVIYDAAHAFGVTYKGKSILEYGDASMVSLHATKLMHAVEGGFIVAKDSAVSEKMEWMRRFGHKGTEAFHGVGTNAKMSELHAAMGLCNLNHVEEILGNRKAVCDAFDRAFSFQPSSLRALVYRQGASRNYSYYPVIFESEAKLLKAMGKMNDSGIFARRYFYPSLEHVLTSMVGEVTEVSRNIASRIACLPLSATQEQATTEEILSILLAE
ncbi:MULTISPECIES: DegT/DnrJ/EryC1/StrS aminotransferase family protein [unclassified Lentimonas]|uniref:DegT/DnrJ/EryC1/StrS family aminotransferase n=1 Tax=unclassified Lentimonas TaxID=2630993 RepID=UPI001322329E|nr:MULTISPECIES: DegT/DnrJ/EryC1/StrS family aminotransferase [unclassified Lentimonas]CAA6680044.1 UDP-4-amino-4-deoxy-L-arabinose--oxoglutarate aminotransferase (EC [Lentimonas sp. CC4]CAA6685164.1 UDP-4-amino-4-deoxy-L-arabinose--oxoglutarate aminotransferase (EC [Lentimonas sp. CC6]CAA7075110.1 UDP-4-amino-4-deoxy-L-arabinose--oxoglutarate aminotransferase (EC [Lentimonas sp. CC4]CAA7168430.1 UDP-4-amino-4-deoxy-L-arabinose--oxoglutarate aminotransferase (EC [Lentimonas sp. CC21]CAA7182135